MSQAALSLYLTMYSVSVSLAALAGTPFTRLTTIKTAMIQAFFPRFRPIGTPLFCFFYCVEVHPQFFQNVSL